MAASIAEVCGTGKYDPEIWFPLSERAVDQIAVAVALCRTCPLRLRCLLGAVERRERDGVWGAATTTQRNAISTHPDLMRRIRREAETEAADSKRSELVGS